MSHVSLRGEISTKCFDCFFLLQNGLWRVKRNGLPNIHRCFVRCEICWQIVCGGPSRATCTGSSRVEQEKCPWLQTDFWNELGIMQSILAILVSLIFVCLYTLEMDYVYVFLKSLTWSLSICMGNLPGHWLEQLQQIVVEWHSERRLTVQWASLGEANFGPTFGAHSGCCARRMLVALEEKRVLMYWESSDFSCCTFEILRFQLKNIIGKCDHDHAVSLTDRSGIWVCESQWLHMLEKPPICIVL